MNNLIPNHAFAAGKPGGMPDGWTAYSKRAEMLPRIALEREDGRHVLALEGNGDDSASGWAAARLDVEAGNTYRMWVRFRLSGDVNPHRHLLFACCSVPDESLFNDGIFHFRRTGPGSAEGEGTFAIPGQGIMPCEIRIMYRLHAGGAVRVEEIGLARCEPAGERHVRVACVEGVGEGNLPLWERVLDEIGRNNADLALLPEEFHGIEPEGLEGPVARMMSGKARQHGMYVAGTIARLDERSGHVHNSCLLYGRQGEFVGLYDKIHPSSPEYLELGVVPGTEVPVFRTDFGTVGMMICYDSWFTDVAELLALKGAELILFPNAGYYRSLMPARANDNGVRIVCSTGTGGYSRLGVWDTSGADVEDPHLDPSRNALNDRTFRDVVTFAVDGIRVLCVTLDLNQSPSAANWGGPMLSSPGGRRNRREQRRLLYQEIESEVRRWWS